ncbi:ROK family glucokinase [Eubacterium xylanophilum]|uniref:ROK family glucokinase n=1 Tax=Eubacterium xylanophilum TaxID=39497 RepID=UPI00047D6E4B|nr:ROK family glucokinase [Eubacterium xylanophilum]
MDKYYIGVDIGGTSIKMGLFSHIGELLEKWEIPTNKEDEGSHILTDIAASIEDKRVEKDGNIIGIGIGVPGPVTDDGTVLKCVNINWPVFNVKKKLSDITGIGNIGVGNDASIAALGEVWKGGGRGFDSIVLVTLGTGVGGGIIIGGKMLTGVRGGAGEIGHITVNPHETATCGCGRKGCLEQYSSATGIVRMAKEGMREDSCLSKLDEITAKDVLDGVKAGDRYCDEVFDKFASYLGGALATIAQVVDPEAFVIGGGVSKAGDMLLERIEKYYRESVMPALSDKEFALAQLGNDAGIYGAVRMVL